MENSTPPTGDVNADDTPEALPTGWCSLKIQFGYFRLVWVQIFGHFELFGIF
jgi:hypothetical protein